MKILAKSTLPEKQEDYFSFYHERAMSEIPSGNDMQNILQELRLAYSKYDNKKRIASMAYVIKMFLNKKNWQSTETNSFKKDIAENLF